MTNKKQKRKFIVPAVLCILAFCLGCVLVFQFFSKNGIRQQRLTNRVQKAVLRRDDLLQQSKQDLIFVFDSLSPAASPLSLDHTLPDHVGAYVYKNDTLVYWNDNPIEPRLMRKRVKASCDTIINLGFGDYLVTSSSKGPYSFYLFSLLNTTYQIENKYFINTFQPIWRNHRLHFNSDNAKGEQPVYSRSGKLLSYLQPDLSQTPKTSDIALRMVCWVLIVLCLYLLVSWIISMKRADRPVTKPRYSVMLPVIVYLLAVVGVIFCVRLLYRYLFTKGFFIPSEMHLDYAFMALFLSMLALVTLIIVLNRLFAPWFKGRSKVLIMMIQFVLWGVLLTLLYDRESTRYENEQIQALALNLADERDLDFENSYGQFLSVAEEDTTFFTTVLSDDIMDEVAEDYMRNFLFDSVMNQYEISLTLCAPGVELEVQPDNVVTDCKSYFFEKVKQFQGIDLGKGLCFLDYNSLDPSYLSMINILVHDTVIPDRMLYIEFSKPIAPQGFGLPKILQSSQNKLPLNYSVACYNDSLLIYKNGSYVYPNYLSDYKRYHSINDFSYGTKLKHYTHQTDDGRVIAITKARRGWMEATAPFVVFFFFLLILYLLIYFFGGIHFNKAVLNTLSYKFQMMVLLALGVSFLVVGPVSVLYLRSQYTQKVNDYHFERTRTLMLDITSEVDFSFLKQPGFKYELDKILKRYSETFFTDINIYGLDGKLLTTTSPEVMDLHLQSSLMNAEAFHNMHGEKGLYYIHEEHLGKAVFQSAYIAIQDGVGKTLAYLNTPYFAGKSDLQSEIFNYVLTYINIILLIFFVFLPIVLVVTHRVTHPLTRLQEKMRQIDINKSNEKLEWNSKDEIGALINQYNQLVVELEKSAAELRRTTAESAWRGVARQVAHEIKNSLTPMRLSVQLLQRSAEQQGGEIDERLQRTTGTLLDQIDALSDIASSFSQYAKLPVNNPQPLDLAELVGNVVNLYDNIDNITFQYHFDPSVDYTFNGDKTNLNSAVGNIIKNATQAIGDNPDGKIDVSLKATETSFVITVKDNGKGIKEEDKEMIFLPNFTTKSGGSGVGLSLTYHIIQSTGGTISFESQEGEGTEFVIELPRGAK